MTLYDAIFTRRSVRSYRMEAIDESILNSIPEFMDEIVPLFPQIDTSLKIIDRVTKKEKISGFANVNAPYYAALYSETKEKAQMNSGYLMEYLSLYLESKGIGTLFPWNGIQKRCPRRGKGQKMYDPSGIRDSKDPWNPERI